MAVKAPFSIQIEDRRFQAWMQEFVKDMDRSQAWLALRKIAFDFIAIVVRLTPVDTGRARAGWTPFLDSEGKGNLVKVSGTGVAQGKSEGSYKKQKRGPIKFIEIINAVPYIIFLEFGHSGQAPGGMFRIAMRIIRLKLKKEGQVALSKAITRTNIIRGKL